MALRQVRRSIRIVQKVFKPLKNFLYVNWHFGVSGSRNLNYKFVYTWHNTRVRDTIANQASFGKFDANELFQQVIDRTEHPNSSGSPQDFQPVLLLELARLSALQPSTEGDVDCAYYVYKYVFENYQNWKQLPSTGVHLSHDFVFLFTCAFTQRFESWRSFADGSKLSRLAEQVVKIDRHHRYISGSSFGKEIWMENFNAIFTTYDLEPVSFLETSNLSEFIDLDSILCSPHRQIDGQLVTVIVSAFNPGKELITSIQSLLSQSWTNLEIILVDDFSQDSTYVDLAVSMDSRIKLIRQERNQGTYAARNAALDIASGDFITFQDSDDWSHPRRIESQVFAFDSSENVMATYAKAVRLTQDLLFTGADGIPWREMNASSLMFRYSVFEELGYFDSVRKGADSEYFYRIVSHYQDKSDVAPIKLCSDAYLSIIRISHGSLSRSEIRTNWKHPVRIHYRESYSQWHKSCISAGITAYMPPNQSSRKFPCPSTFEIDRIPSELDKQDIVVALDLTSVSESMVSIIEEAIALECSVAILNVLPESGSELLNAHLMDMVYKHQVRLITVDDKIECRLMIVGHIKLFQYPSPLPWNISYGKISVISDETLVSKIDNVSSTKMESLKAALGYYDQPIDFSKVKKHAPVDLTQATWFSDSNEDFMLAKKFSMKLVPRKKFDLKSELGLKARD
jgi:hypothetical protein